MDGFMQLAIQEANAARAEGNYPYGSVLVCGDEIIGLGRNQMNTHNDPTSHAEIEVLRRRFAGILCRYHHVCQRLPLHHVRWSDRNAWNSKNRGGRKLGRL